MRSQKLTLRSRWPLAFAVLAALGWPAPALADHAVTDPKTWCDGAARQISEKQAEALIDDITAHAGGLAQRDEIAQSLALLGPSLARPQSAVGEEAFPISQRSCHCAHASVDSQNQSRHLFPGMTNVTGR